MNEEVETLLRAFPILIIPIGLLLIGLCLAGAQRFSGWGKEPRGPRQ